MQVARPLALLLAAVLWAVPMRAQDLDVPDHEIPEPTAEELQASRQAASEALQVVAALADPVLDKLGLAAAGTRAQATLGEPIPVFNLNLSHIQDLGNGEDPRKLLTRSDEMFYPISIDGEVVSSVTVVKGDGGWEMTSIGQSHLTAKLVKLQGLMKWAGEHVVAVNVPAMYQMFLVNASGKLPIFVPVYDVPVLELLAMQTLGGSELFDKLKSLVDRFESALRHEEDEEDG